jgi:hypothetical protein
MSLSFPYHFDTTGVSKIIFRGMIVILLIIFFPGLISVAGLLFEGAPATDIAVTLAGMVVSAAFTAGFGLFIFKKLGGVSGEITAESITVSPAVMMGVRAEAPEGTFDLRNFKAVSLVHIHGKHGRHERIYLKGYDGTPEIQLAATRRGAGTDLAAQLSALLKLPVEETRAPY